MCAISIQCSSPSQRTGTGSPPSGVYPRRSDGFVAAPLLFFRVTVASQACTRAVNPVIMEITQISKRGGTGGRFGDFLCVDCARIYIGGCNHFTNTMLTSSNIQIFKSKDEEGCATSLLCAKMKSLNKHRFVCGCNNITMHLVLTFLTNVDCTNFEQVLQNVKIPKASSGLYHSLRALPPCLSDCCSHEHEV